MFPSPLSAYFPIFPQHGIFLLHLFCLNESKYLFILNMQIHILFCFCELSSHVAHYFKLDILEFFLLIYCNFLYITKMKLPIIIGNIFIVFSTVVSIFTLLHPPPNPSLPLTLETTSFGFVHASFIHVPWCLFPCYPSHHSTLVTVSLFFISMTLVIFCFLVCFVD